MKHWQSRFPYSDENTNLLIINDLWLFTPKIPKIACKRKKKKKSNIKEKEKRKGTKGEGSLLPLNQKTHWTDIDN